MEIVGHEKILAFLEKALSSDFLSHCYIFSGPDNIGKGTVARWFVGRILNTNAETIVSAPNYFEIRPDKNSIGKEEIDKAIARLSMSALGGGHKMLIVESAHQMTTSAANAFLKTLEEPSGKTIIILLTSELGKILPTIVSRAVVVRFNPVGRDALRKLLADKNIADPKKYINPSFGRPGKMLNLLEDENWQAEKGAQIEEFYNLFWGDNAERFRAAAHIFQDKDGHKENIGRKIDQWLEFARDIFLIKYKLYDNVAHPSEKKHLEKIAGRGTADHFCGLAKRLIKMRNLIKNNVNVRLMLENLII